MNYKVFSITLLSFSLSFCSSPKTEEEKPLGKTETVDSVTVKATSAKPQQATKNIEEITQIKTELEAEKIIEEENNTPSPSVIQEQLFTIEKARIKLSSRQSELQKVNYVYTGPFTETSQTWFFDESNNLVFYQSKSGLEGKTDESTFVALSNGEISSFSKKINDGKREEVITWDNQTSEKAVKIIHDWENESEYLEYTDSEFNVADFKKYLPSKQDFIFDSHYVYARTDENPVEGKDPVRTVITMDSLIFQFILQ